MKKILLTAMAEARMKALLTIGLAVALSCGCPVASESVTWVTPDRDCVGGGSPASPNGINDWHIRLTTDKLAGSVPVGWRIRGGATFGLSDQGRWLAPTSVGYGPNSEIKVETTGNQFDLFFDPLLAWPGDVFDVTAVLGADSSRSWRILSDGAPWLTGAAWLGQGSDDQLGPVKPQPDGIRDWGITLYNDFLLQPIARVDVWLPYQQVGSRLRGANVESWFWSSDSNAPPLAYQGSAGQLRILINPVLATGGDQFFIRVVRTDGNWAVWKVCGMGSDLEANGTWFGQDVFDNVGMTDTKPDGILDWHLQVSSPRLSHPVRWVVRGAQCVWETILPGVTNRVARALMADVQGTTANLYLNPAMERAGDIFYVSAVLENGSVLNWGVTSVRQLRSNDVEWRGQSPERYAPWPGPGVTNRVQQWCIAVNHEKLGNLTPYCWTISHGAAKWQCPLDPLGGNQVKPIECDASQTPVRLYIEPQLVKPGDEFDVQAVFSDGSLVQWTTLANGAEFACGATWLDSAGSDRVGLVAGKGTDNAPDWVIGIVNPCLSEPVAQIDVTGCGWHWQWPDALNVSPICVSLSSGHATLNIAPVPVKENSDDVLTVRALFADGTLRYWQVLRRD